jgi:RecA-family ATPase
VVQDIIHKKGLTLFIGPTKEGKTTMAMNLAIKLAGGFENWLGFPIKDKNQRILYASHEMDQSQVNTFSLEMLAAPPFEKFKPRIDENLHVNATGFTIPLNTTLGQQAYEEALAEGQYTGFIIDTLKSSVSGALSEEKPMTGFVDWIMNVIQKYNIWVLVLHHVRKGQQVNKKTAREIEIDDSFGAGVLTHRATGIFSYDRKKFVNLRGRFANGQAIPLTYIDGWIERGSGTVGTSRDSENSGLTGVAPPPGQDGLEKETKEFG